MEIIFYCTQGCSENGRSEQRELTQNGGLVYTTGKDLFCPICEGEVIWDVLHEWEENNYGKQSI